MRTYVIKDRRPILLGRVGENEATTIKFNIASFFPGMSGATYGLIHKLPEAAAPYVVETTHTVISPEDGRVRDGFINWVVKDIDLVAPGNGVAQLTAYRQDGSVYKTAVFTTVIENSLGVVEPPKGTVPWADKVIEAAGEVYKSVQAAATSASQAESAAASVPTTVDTALAEAKASGEFDGADGQDGYSPTVSVTDIEGGHRVTITDVDGDHVFDVMDGEDGSSGGGTTNYNNLTNKPKINGYTLSGERTAAGLDLAQALWVDDYTTTEELYDAWIEGRYIARKDSGRVYTLAYRYDNGGSVYYVFTCLEDDGAWYVWKRDNAGNWDTVTQYSPPQGAITGTPAMDGTASRGSSEYYARADHVHPTDTSRAPAAAAVPVGGTKGYSLKKKSSTDYDVEWGPNAFDLDVTTNSSTHVSVANVAPAVLSEKLNSGVVNCNVLIGSYYGILHIQGVEYTVSQGVTYWTYRFAGIVLDSQNAPAIAIVEFPNQAQSATSLVGTGYAYPLQLST